MANFRVVNKAIKKEFPDRNIEVVRGYGYVYFDNKDGFDVIDSIMTNPTTTDTDTLIRMCIEEIKDFYS